MLTAMYDADGRTCTIYSDSEFWINVLTKWAPGWKAKGWRKSSGEIKNLELVKELYSVYLESDAKLVWVKGHANDEGNIMADKYALIASGAYRNTDEDDRLVQEALIEVWKNHEEFAPEEIKPGWCGTCQEIGDVAKSAE